MLLFVFFLGNAADITSDDGGVSESSTSDLIPPVATICLILFLELARKNKTTEESQPCSLYESVDRSSHLQKSTQTYTYNSNYPARMLSSRGSSKQVVSIERKFTSVVASPTYSQLPRFHYILSFSLVCIIPLCPPV